MPQPAFDDLSDVYEAMIDWPRRLAREEPFYRRLFERSDARRVLDADQPQLLTSWREKLSLLRETLGSLRVRPLARGEGEPLVR